MPTTTYLLRDIDSRLWARLKAKADSDGLSLRSLIVALLTAYLDGRVHVAVTAGDVMRRAPTPADRS